MLVLSGHGKNKGQHIDIASGLPFSRLPAISALISGPPAEASLIDILIHISKVLMVRVHWRPNVSHPRFSPSTQTCLVPTALAR